MSAQVLSEFFVTVTRKISVPLTPDEAYERMKNYLQAWTVQDSTGLIVLEAVRGVREHQFAFWDALIWATARLNQISVVFSEDFNTEAVIDGVRFVNPFDGDFSPRSSFGNS